LLGFSANIIRAIEAKKDRKFLYLLYGLFTVMLIAGIAFIGLYLNDAILILVKGTLTNYKWIILFYCLMVIAIQFADKKCRQKKLLK
jgi:hypothetical protein